jgi:hypothetical protein
MTEPTNNSFIDRLTRCRLARFCEVRSIETNSPLKSLGAQPHRSR